MENQKTEVEKLENGEAWDDDDEVVEIEVKRPLDKVIPVRLSSDKWEALRQEAREVGVGPTTLARMWILEKLRQQTTSAAGSRRSKPDIEEAGQSARPL